MERLRTSPLDAEHRRLGARMGAFGGWEMPLHYTGVLDEHRQCRVGAAVFDVSHLGTVSVRGPAARELLQWAFTNDLRRIAAGRAQYTHLLDPRDAHVVDDLIVWWCGEDEFAVMPNASNTDRLLAAFDEWAPPADDRRLEPQVSVADVTSERAVLAVQGPDARARLGDLAPAMALVARWHVATVDWHGLRCVVAGTGYTGEDGVEIQVPADGAAQLWRALLETGVVPAGLGARDTLRLEAGLPLHGHELGPGITPLQAGLGWVVRPDKGEFRGRAPFELERAAGPARRLTGVVTDGRQPPRSGAAVRAGGAAVGTVTSGNFSPTLGRGIALALVDAGIPDGTDVMIDLRAKPCPGRLVRPPFVRRP